MDDLPKLKDNINIDNKVKSDNYEAMTEARKAKDEKIFLYYFFGIILFDAILFIFIVDGLAALSVTILQVILLLVLGSKYSIKSIDIIFKRITTMLTKEKNIEN